MPLKYVFVDRPTNYLFLFCKIGPVAPEGRFVCSGAAAGFAFLARRSRKPPRARGLVKKKMTEGAAGGGLTRQGQMTQHLLLFFV